MNGINQILNNQLINEVPNKQLPANSETIKKSPEFKLLLDSMIEQFNNKQATQQIQPNTQLNLATTPINQPVVAQNIRNNIQFDENNDDLIKNKKKRKSPAETLMQELDFENTLSVTPFQYFSETAVNALKEISDQEFHVNKLMQEYIDGKVSIEEVSIETTKLNLAISFASTVISTASQTFKELISMQI